MKDVIGQVKELQDALESKNSIIEAIKTLLTGKAKKVGKRGRPAGSKNKKKAKAVAKKAHAKTIKVKAETHKNGADQEVTA